MNEPAWNAKAPQMPVDSNGNFIHYPSWNVASWETLHVPFWAVCEIDGMFSGRSAKYLILKDVGTGRTWPMFISDLVNSIQNNVVEVKDAKLKAYWFGSKKGANYGMKPVEW